MAKLVGAFGTSHSPALASPAEDMPGHARRDEMYAHHLDREGRRVSYAQLLKQAPAGIDISPQTAEKRVAACEAHLNRLSSSLREAKLDALARAIRFRQDALDRLEAESARSLRVARWGWSAALALAVLVGILGFLCLGL